MFIAPVGVSVGSATTSTINVAVKPPQLPGEIRLYEIAIGPKKCEAQAGSSTPSCTLAGLAAGTQYHASATSLIEDGHAGSQAIGEVNTLPDGRGFRFFN